MGRLTGKRLLGVFAHPDDETYSLAGCIARYAEEGCRTTIITFTRGEAGQIAPGSGAERETLGATREAELRDAMRIAGCDDVRVVGTPDGGTQVSEEGVGVIEGALRELEPDVLITMEPEGITRHPDHVAVSAMTREAFERVREQGYPAKLYLAAIPVAMMASFTTILKARGVQWISEDDPLSPRAAPDESIAAIVDVSRWADIKRAALKAHATQGDEMVNWIPEDVFHVMFGTETFQRAHPRKVPGVPPETDLFQGIA